MLEKKTINYVFFCTLVLLNIVFFIYWFFLALNYCPHYDDVHFMWMMREYSIFEYVKEMYFSRGGNFIGYTINGIIFSLSNQFVDYHLWPIIFYFIGVIITFVIAKSIIKESVWFKILVGVLTFYNVYILTSVDCAIFTWLCATGYFILAPSLCLLIYLINKGHLTYLQWGALLLSSVFISGNAVSISTITFCVLFVNACAIWYMHSWNIKSTWHDYRIRRIVGVTVLMMCIFAIVVAAPGNYLRISSEADIEQPKNTVEFIMACIKCITMFFYMEAFYLPYYIIIVVLGYLVGSRICISLPSVKKCISYIIGGYIIYVLISVMPLAYLSNGFQIQRNYTQLTYFLMLTVFIVGIVLGSKFDKKNHIYVTGMASAIFLMIVMVFNIFQDIPVAVRYSEAHYTREQMLLELNKNGNKNTIYVKPFPLTHTPDAKYNILKLFGIKTYMPAIYYESDTSTDVNEYEKHVKRLLNLNFDFILREERNAKIN